MVSMQPPVCDFNQPAVGFNLVDARGKTWSLKDCSGEKGLLIFFICNHCPYVKAILPRLVRDTDELKTLGINSVAIMSNDMAMYEEDSVENMLAIAAAHHFSFPYLIDATQEVAKSYGAVCTPDFFGYNHDLKLQYRGRLDASRKETATGDVTRDLFNAMKMVAATNSGPQEQIASMGCSIKWLT